MSDSSEFQIPTYTYTVSETLDFGTFRFQLKESCLQGSFFSEASTNKCHVVLNHQPPGLNDNPYSQEHLDFLVS